MKVVILAGGLGARLKPFTQVIPKPLLPIGESSVLEIQLLTLKDYGVTEVFIATNYMSEFVKAYIGDGSRFGMKVHFSHEEKPLGTCGPITLIKEFLTEPFILMNGDILTTLDFKKAYDAAIKLESDLTVITTELITPFSFGKVMGDGNYITHLQEKPDIKFEILAGIYVMKPGVFDLIPSNEHYGIDRLVKTMLSSGKKVGKYLMKEYWLDIGQVHHYDEAQVAYQEHFKHLRPSQN